MTRLLVLAVAAFSFVGSVEGAEAVSGLKEGDAIGAFYVTKIAGAEDEVESGERLCYRCRYGQRPMVIIFSQKSSPELEDMLSQLDEEISEHKEDQLKSFVTLVGKDSKAVTQQAKDLAKASGVENLPVAIAEELPGNYKLDPKNDVSVVIANNGKVVSSHSFSADSIDVAAVLSDIDEMLH